MSGNPDSTNNCLALPEEALDNKTICVYMDAYMCVYI